MFTKNEWGEVITERGKYRGYAIGVIPQDYLEWLRDRSKATVDVIEQELTRREQVAQGDSSLVSRIIATGYKQLATKAHPDHGGDTNAMRELNAAYERLKEIVKDQR